MKFGISLGDAPASKSLSLLRAAERSGFDQIWVWDSHIIWQEAYSLMGWLIGESTDDTLEWGTMVTNPRTRDPMVVASAFATLNEITGGRVICGIGRGDSSVRVIKRKPANLADLEEAVNIVKTMTRGDSWTVETGEQATMPWASGGSRVYVAAYGPKALELAGRTADGVIFQVADPYFIEWGMQHVRRGAEIAGKNPDDVVIHVATASYLGGDLDEAREQTRWFPAVVGNHIAEVLRRNDTGDIPDELVSYVRSRGDYDYREHAEQGTDHSKYVPDEIVDRFCVIGDDDAVLAKLRELAALGVSEFNLYPHVAGIESVIEYYGANFAPAFRN